MGNALKLGRPLTQSFLLIFVCCGGKIPVRLDGPYAGSTTSTWNYEHCVYVAGGIGVTPFASLLQSIMRQFKDSMTKCANCSHSNCSRIPASMGKLKHVQHRPRIFHRQFSIIFIE